MRPHILGTIALLVGACESTTPLPPVLWEGRIVRFRSDESLGGVCGGTLEHLDERALHVIERFDVPEAPVDYVWAPGEALGEYCDLPTLACSDGRLAISVFPVHEHELFHAVRGSSAHRGLEEGMAVAFGDDRILPGEVEGDIEAILRETGEYVLIDALDYPRLGHFASYLHAGYGLEQLVELDHRSDLTHGYGELSADVEAVMGRPMAAVIADYASSYPVCDSTYFRDTGFECGRNVIEMPDEDGEELVTTVRVACDDPATLGPRAGEIWKTMTLEVPADGRHFLSVIPTDAVDASIKIRRCGASCFDLDPALMLDGQYWMGLVPCLHQGTYTLRLGRKAGTEGEFRIEVLRMDFKDCE